MFAELAELIRGEVVAPDLPGHGGRDDTNTDWHEAVDEVAGLIETHQPQVVIGYSMGGRLALGAGLDGGGQCRGPVPLVMVSVALGIAARCARESRRVQDEALAVRIEDGSVEEFIAEWEQRGQLGGHEELAAVRRRNSAQGLAAALRGMGQGAQPYLGGRLHELEAPSIWIAGAADPKYTAIARQAAATAPRARAVIGPHAKHNVVATAPRTVADTVNGLIS